MNFGFIRVSANNFKTKVADCFFNAEQIINSVKTSYKNNVLLAVFPELCLTGYTCQDLFLQKSLIDDSKTSLQTILENTKDLNISFIIGMPIEIDGKLFNCGVTIYKGEILGIVPKIHLPNYNEFYEKRYFSPAFENVMNISILGQTVPFGTNIIFNVKNIEGFKFCIEICEDLWHVIPPSSYHSLAGATITANLSASNEVAHKDIKRRSLVTSQSSRCIGAYIYSSCGEGESTTDTVFSAHNIISENGNLISESSFFKPEITYGDIDLSYILNKRRKNTSFCLKNEGYVNIDYEMKEVPLNLNRKIDPHPFLYKKDSLTNEKILNIQAHGLKSRMEYINTKKTIIGISGGLDSTYALLVINRTYEILNYDKKDIIAVTMPCFGTSNKTYENAKKLCSLLGVTLVEINIKDSVLNHFKDISHNPNDHDLTYENSQARERAQILMDLSSKYGGFVVGTSDLSEIALGFSTYNGDHMSMYSVNSGVPKTLIQHLILHFANTFNEELKNVLIDIVKTPISPELLPPDSTGEIKQVTEQILGSYELNDFFLYNFLEYGHSPEKIYYLSKIAFKNKYTEEEILKYLKAFYKRFFTQQYKRSCSPDGVKVLSFSLSPRTDFKMSSDTAFTGFLKNLDNLK